MSDLADGFEWITWEIGQAKLQKSVMARETFDALSAGQTNVVKIRGMICGKRKLAVKLSTGKWTATPSDRFVSDTPGSWRE